MKNPIVYIGSKALKIEQLVKKLLIFSQIWRLYGGFSKQPPQSNNQEISTIAIIMEA